MLKNGKLKGPDSIPTGTSKVDLETSVFCCPFKKRDQTPKEWREDIPNRTVKRR